ncbi:MAG: hypothetical protein HFH35_10620 [Eubacterium sp.]|nr:hypothetical protein [Eubacterium sp.]
MKKSGITRALRYFIGIGEQYVLCAAGLGAAMTIYMWLINSSASFSDMLTSIPGSILFIAGTILYVTGVSVVQQCYSLLISMGCRRRNVFAGNLVMDLLYIAQCIILYEVLERIFNPRHQPVSALFVLAVYLLVEAFGKLSGIVVVKFGKLSRMVFFGATVGIAISAAVYFSLSGGADIQIWADELTGKDALLVQWVLAGAAAACCAGSYVFLWRLLKNYEVRI